MPTTPTLDTKPTNHQSNRPLYRSESDRMLAGICGGIAEYFGWDAALVRLTFIAIILLGGSGILAYILLWVILPTQSELSQVSQVSEKTLPLLPKSVPPKTTTTSNVKQPGWGIFLIGIGTLLLLHNFGIAQYIQLDRTWPVVLVVIGFLILSK